MASEGPNIGFAIPINMAKVVVRDLLLHGKVRRPYLGIVGKNILSTDEVEDGAVLNGVYGVIVQNLIVEGPGTRRGSGSGT